MASVMHQSNACFKEAANSGRLHFGWHEYDIGLHTEPYINRDLIDYVPRLMGFFASRH